VLGPGKIVSAQTRTARRSCLEVHVSGRSPVLALAAKLPGARPVDLAELAETSDVLAVTVPLHVALGLDADALRGAVVIDATNPWGDADEAAIAQARPELGALAEELSTRALL